MDQSTFNHGKSGDTNPKGRSRSPLLELYTRSLRNEREEKIGHRTSAACGGRLRLCYTLDEGKESERETTNCPPKRVRSSPAFVIVPPVTVHSFQFGKQTDGLAVTFSAWPPMRARSLHRRPRCAKPASGLPVNRRPSSCRDGCSSKRNASSATRGCPPRRLPTISASRIRRISAASLRRAWAPRHAASDAAPAPPEVGPPCVTAPRCLQVARWPACIAERLVGVADGQ